MHEANKVAAYHAEVFGRVIRTDAFRAAPSLQHTRQTMRPHREHVCLNRRTISLFELILAAMASYLHDSLLYCISPRLINAALSQP